MRDAFPPPKLYSSICVWKRRCADVRAGTQAPLLRILLERITRGCSPLHISFGQIARGTVDVVWVDCAEKYDGVW